MRRWLGLATATAAGVVAGALAVEFVELALEAELERLRHELAVRLCLAPHKRPAVGS